MGSVGVRALITKNSEELYSRRGQGAKISARVNNQERLYGSIGLWRTGVFSLSLTCSCSVSS
jgi:hypothetical protein